MPLFHWLSLRLIRLSRWRYAGALPDCKKYVIIAAPHSSNWDFILAMGIAFAFQFKVFWLGKHTLFRWPFGGLMRWLGGIAVDRRANHNLVAQSIKEFAKRDELVIGIPPEGTRSKVATWKTGFYHIAQQAHVPIVLGYFDNERKIVGLGPLFHPTGDLEKDMAEIRAFYQPLKSRQEALAAKK